MLSCFHNEQTGLRTGIMKWIICTVKKLSSAPLLISDSGSTVTFKHNLMCWSSSLVKQPSACSYEKSKSPGMCWGQCFFKHHQSPQNSSGAMYHDPRNLHWMTHLLVKCGFVVLIGRVVNVSLWQNASFYTEQFISPFLAWLTTLKTHPGNKKRRRISYNNHSIGSALSALGVKG